MTEPTPTPQYRRKTDDEVAALAKRIYRHEVFISWMLKRQEDLPMVFMVLNFMEKPALDQLVVDNIHFFYEAYSEAGPMSVNGYPTFFSVHYLDREDGARVHAKVREIAELVG
jgi:hypothetical protein